MSKQPAVTRERHGVVLSSLAVAALGLLATAIAWMAILAGVTRGQAIAMTWFVTLCLVSAAAGLIVLLQRDKAKRSVDQQARESMLLLRDAVEDIEESFSLCDAEGRYVVTNRRFRENNTEIAPYVQPGCRYEAAVRAALARGMYLDAVGREDAWYEERMARRRDRSSPPSEQRRKGGVWILNRETHLGDGSIITLGLDITESKRAEEELRDFNAGLEQRVAARSAELADREAMLRLVTENVPIGIAYYDAESRLRFANRNYLFSLGLPADAAVLGKHVRELIPADMLREYQPYIDRALSGSEVRYEAHRVLHGSLRTGETLLVPQKAPDGRTAGVFVAIVDITKRKQAEMVLAAREAMLRLVTESIPIKIVYWDASCRAVFANSQYARAIGQDSADAVIGRHMSELIPKENYSRHVPMFERVLAGETLRYEYTRPVGEKDTQDIHLVPDRAADGSVRGVFAALVDIADLKSAQSALENSLSLLESTLESTADGILVVGSDGRISRFNRRFVQMWGIPDCILDTRNDKRAIGFVLEKLSDPAPFTARIEELYGHPEAESFDVLGFKDGRVFERFSRPQRVAGATVGRVWSFRDVTARFRTEAALRASEERLRELIDIAPFQIALRDRDGRCLLTNRVNAAIFGLTPDEMMGRTVAEIGLSVGAIAATQAAIRAMRDSGAMQVDPEFTLVDHAGRKRVFIATRIPFQFSDEQPDCVLAVLGEITELKAVEEEVRNLNAELEARVNQRTSELALANKELEAFSYTVSHDLRAPARAVAGFSQMLLEDHSAELGPDAKGLLRRLSAAGERMGEMIDGLLRLARISRAGLFRAPLDLSAMARVAWDEAAGTDPARHVAFSVQDNVHASADRILMRNVLQNLLGNAFKYTRPTQDGAVTFGATDGPGGTVYFVRDNGVGFDMAHANKLFGVFQRVHGYDEFEGTGVGLATAQRIIARHGGRIWAESRPGQGATFYFTLAGSGGPLAMDGTPPGVA